MDDKTYAIDNDIKRRDHKDQRKTDSKSNKSSSRAGGQRSNSAFSSSSHTNNSVHSNSAPVPSTSSSDPVPMEVDAIKHGPLSAEEKEHRRREGLCFYCGKGKHTVNNCPNMSEKAKKRSQPRANSGKASSSGGKA